VLKDWYLTVAHWRQAPIRVHVLTPVGVWFLTGGFQPGAWLGMILVILFHELGHAFIVHRVGGRARSIDVLPIGGLCHWQGDVTPIGRACIAWGGVWAQMVLAAATLLWMQLFPAHSEFESQLTWSFTTRSGYLILLNLLPIAPLDGAEAWRLFPLWYRRWKTERHRTIQREQETSVLTRLRNAKAQDSCDDIPEEAKGVVIDLFKNAKSKKDL
jgi:stage IV sporulation protein FB